VATTTFCQPPPPPTFHRHVAVITTISINNNPTSGDRDNVYQHSHVATISINKMAAEA
jgi:hypothetical protein